jgi:hypothetical protein
MQEKISGFSSQINQPVKTQVGVSAEEVLAHFESNDGDR